LSSHCCPAAPATPHSCLSLLLSIWCPPRSTLFPYTTLFRSRSFMFVFRGNYIISGTISCVHKKPDDEPRFESSSGFHFGLRVFSDRKSTRLNSSHVSISYAVFCLKKKKQPRQSLYPARAMRH